MSDEPRAPWDRRPREKTRAHELFRRFRDLGPLRSLDALVDPQARITYRALRDLQRKNDWIDRANAWDDYTHRIDDARRIEEIRGMHERHQRAGRLVQARAIAALQQVAPEDIPPYAAARLLELGTRLERDILTTSVEDLQRIPGPQVEDPWDAVARELESLPDS